MITSNHEQNCYKEAIQGMLPGQEAIRKKVLDDTREYKKASRKSAWLVPALACACAAVVICTAVPPVRAAVADFFRSVGAYMSTPSEERPQVEGVTVQDDIQQQPSSAALYDDLKAGTTTAVPEQDWRNNVAVEIKEVMYDGEGLYMTYVVDGSAVGLSTYEIPGNLANVDPNNAPLFTTANVILPDDSIVVPKYQSVTNDGGLITITAEYSERGNYLLGDGTIRGLSGEQKLEFEVHLNDATFDMEKISKGEPDYVIDEPGQGLLSMPLVFNADNSMTVVDENTYTINGRQIVFDAVNIKPTDISIDLRIPYVEELQEAYAKNLELFKKKHNEGLSEAEEEEFKKSTQTINELNDKELSQYLDFEVYLDGERLKGNLYEGYDGFMNGLMNNEANDAIVGQMVIPFPNKEAKELKLVPSHRETGEKYEADTIIIALK